MSNAWEKKNNLNLFLKKEKIFETFKTRQKQLNFKWIYTVNKNFNRNTHKSKYEYENNKKYEIGNYKTLKNIFYSFVNS